MTCETPSEDGKGAISFSKFREGVDTAIEDHNHGLPPGLSMDAINQNRATAVLTTKTETKLPILNEEFWD